MKIINNSLLIGRLFGIPIRLHISMGLFLLLGLFFPASWIYLLIIEVGIFGSVVLHELGHALVARAKGSYIHEIVLYPIGGAAKMSNIPRRPLDEIQVALAGPAVSLMLALFFTRFTPFQLIGYVNGMLFLFNMLPVFPMDGGRVLRAALVSSKGRTEATRIAATTGKYFCWGFVLVGLFGLPLQWQFNGQVWGPIDRNFFLAFIGFYIYRAGQMEYRMVLYEHQAEQFSSFQDGSPDVEVSPPPYAQASGASWIDKLKRLFRNG